MDIREYVNKLLASHPDSADMEDFKEEICSNLQERINYLIKKGADREEAFNKATEELGDISEIADQISNDKRKGAIGSMYMNTRNYLDKWHVGGYILAGGLLSLGFILTLSSYFNTGKIAAGLGSVMIFLIVPLIAFVFLGLTQETAASYPMPWMRSLCYAAAAGLIMTGLAIFVKALFRANGFSISQFPGSFKFVASAGSLLPTILPGALLLAFLLLTEQDRSKPWVVELKTAWLERVNKQFTDPYTATKFGLYSGALWIFAIALSVSLGFYIGFQYSWTVLLFAAAGQVLLQAILMPKNKQ